MKHPWRFVPLMLVVALGVVLSSCAAPAVVVTPTAPSADPLFINMTTDDPHRANMALSFGIKQLERGHPLTVFLNDKGVYVGSTVNADKYAEHQKMLTTLMAKGAVIYICPMCMQHYGVGEADLLPGLKVSDPVAIGAALFQPNGKTLIW